MFIIFLKKQEAVEYQKQPNYLCLIVIIKYISMTKNLAG